MFTQTQRGNRLRSNSYIYKNERDYVTRFFTSDFLIQTAPPGPLRGNIHRVLAHFQ